MKSKEGDGAGYQGIKYLFKGHKKEIIYIGINERFINCILMSLMIII
jgi:hypothetical protein